MSEETAIILVTNEAERLQLRKALRVSLGKLENAPAPETGEPIVASIDQFTNEILHFLKDMRAGVQIVMTDGPDEETKQEMNYIGQS